MHLREGKLPWLIRVFCIDDNSGRDGTAGGSAPKGPEDKHPQPSSAMADGLTDPYESKSDSESFFEDDEEMELEGEFAFHFRIAKPSDARGRVTKGPARPKCMS